MIEAKVIQVQNNTDVINKSNEIWAYFGWQVMNVQVTFSQNTKTYTKLSDFMLNTGIDTVETTTVDYVTITYQRDTDIQNYNMLFKLENEFNEIAKRIDYVEVENRIIQEDNIAAKLTKLGMVLCVPFGLAIMLNFNTMSTIGGLALAIGGPVLIKKMYDNTTGKQYEEMRIEKKNEYKKLKRELAEILNQAADL